MVSVVGYNHVRTPIYQHQRAPRKTSRNTQNRNTSPKNRTQKDQSK